MENAFTKKPDLSKFIKQVKHSHHVSQLGRKVSSKPTPEQRAKFFDVITPGKNE